MTYQYIDGINDLCFQDGTIRGTLVIQEPHFNSSETSSAEGALMSMPLNQVIPVGGIITSVRGAMQIRAALDAMIQKLVDNKLLTEPEGKPSPQSNDHAAKLVK